MTTKAELQEKLDAANWAIDGYERERAWNREVADRAIKQIGKMTEHQFPGSARVYGELIEVATGNVPHEASNDTFQDFGMDR